MSDFIAQPRRKESRKGSRQDKPYSMHDNRWEQPEEEKQEKQDKVKDSEPVSVETEDQDDDQWEDASDEEEEEEEEEEEKERGADLPEPAEIQPKPLSPFSPDEGYRPVTDWAEEMEVASPRANVQDHPLPGSPAVARLQEDAHREDTETGEDEKPESETVDGAQPDLESPTQQEPRSLSAETLPTASERVGSGGATSSAPSDAPAERGANLAEESGQALAGSDPQSPEGSETLRGAEEQGDEASVDPRVSASALDGRSSGRPEESERVASGAVHIHRLRDCLLPVK
ncbi:histone H3.v1-like [Callorhinchus milii]|uniref:histone H3.v1-like n=1 Tax=Callorhinchus milii TaxID=7868 RepID=UPI001C3FCA5C|nr:histone H3.v1-like [Callorhinchus milii]